MLLPIKSVQLLLPHLQTLAPPAPRSIKTKTLTGIMKSILGDLSNKKVAVFFMTADFGVSARAITGAAE